MFLNYLSTSFLILLLIFIVYDVVKPLNTFYRLNNHFLENRYNVYISDLDIKSNDLISSLAKSYNKLSQHLQKYEQISESYTELVNTKKMLLKELEVRKALEHSTEVYLQQLELMYENVEEFSYMTSHDLKAPLKTLVSFIELLCEDVEENNKESINEDLRHIKETAKRMDKIIGNILELSRSGINPLQLDIFSFDAALKSVLDSLHSSINDKNVTIICDYTDLNVCADKILIERVLQNLLSNSIKFSPNDSKIKINLNESEAEWVVSIEDYGIGIKKDELKNIFKPFNRLNGFSEYEGSGIGLSICDKIVSRHNGKIWVESFFGTGSTFNFTLSKELITVYEQNKSIID